MAKGIRFQPQGANPLPNPTDVGFWINSSGELIYEAGSYGPQVNFSQVAQTVVSASANLLQAVENGSGLSAPRGTPVAIDSNGEMQFVNVTSQSSAASCIGVYDSTVADGAIGQVVTHGRLINFTTSATFGDALYISKTGTLTSTYPSIGVDGFTDGDYVVRIGVVTKNPDNGSQKDLIVNVQIIGQL